MSSPLQAQILGAINSVRPDLYGAGFKIKILKLNGIDKQYDELAEIETDFMVSIDRTGNAILMLMTDSFKDEMREASFLVFQGWVYQFTEPAKPEQGPFPMWKATGRPLHQRYVPDP